jgi:predicted RNase H-like nuclease
MPPLSKTLRGISIQSFRLFPKILEVDRCVGDRRILEVHPEVSFATKQRFQLPEQFNGDRQVGVDDVLDAAAAAWSGRRWMRGEAAVFPAEASDADASGRVIQIVA